MKLTYWVSECLYDNRAYSIRHKTKRGAMIEREMVDNDEYGPVKKVTVEYKDAFDLLCQCVDEGSMGWESDGMTD